MHGSCLKVKMNKEAELMDLSRVENSFKVLKDILFLSREVGGRSLLIAYVYFSVQTCHTYCGKLEITTSSLVMHMSRASCLAKQSGRWSMGSWCWKRLTSIRNGL
jgi:hypothetical protein